MHKIVISRDMLETLASATFCMAERNKIESVSRSNPTETRDACDNAAFKQMRAYNALDRFLADNPTIKYFHITE